MLTGFAIVQGNWVIGGISWLLALVSGIYLKWFFEK